MKKSVCEMIHRKGKSDFLLLVWRNSSFAFLFFLFGALLENQHIIKHKESFFVYITAADQTKRYKFVRRL